MYYELTTLILCIVLYICAVLEMGAMTDKAEHDRKFFYND